MCPELGLGPDLPADREILYQPDYWQDRADDLRRLAEALREETEFYHKLNAQADLCEGLARKALTLRQKRANYTRRAPKYFFRTDASGAIVKPPIDTDYSPVSLPSGRAYAEERIVDLIKRPRRKA